MGTDIIQATRNLPATLTGDVERLGYRMLSALDRLGFIHETRDGAVFTIRFDAVRLYGATWAAFHVDAERLYHFSVSDLSKPDVLAQLSASVRKPVRALVDPGLAFVVELSPKPKIRLPDRVTLDLGQRPSGDLLVPLGVGSGGATWRELRDIGHCLIVGTTGAGKSNFLHVAIAALASSVGPDRLRLALIDPKRHELNAWAGVPHMMGDIAYTPEQAEQKLVDLCREIDRRGDLLAGELVRDLKAFNKKGTDPLPYILAIVDECLDLTSEKSLTEPLKMIARRGRSVGVILWCATQHASSLHGMPRVVNVNLASRFVFRVADRAAAEIGGCPGAELLPHDRPGRMLAKIDGAPVELQGFYLDDDSLLAVTRGLAGNTAKSEKLPEGEAALVRFAVERLQGRFVKNALVAAFSPDWTDHRVKSLAQEWERRGLLTKPAHRAEARRVTPELARLAGLGDVGEIAHASPTQETESPTPVIQLVGLGSVGT